MPSNGLPPFRWGYEKPHHSSQRDDGRICPKFPTSQGRWLVEDMNVITSSSGAGAFYAADFNSVTFRDLWLNGSYGTNGAAIYLFGSTASSALVADINNVQYGGAGGASSTSSYGLVVDGGVATVNIRSFSSVACFCGVITLNTPGLSSFAQFIEGDTYRLMAATEMELF